MVWACKVSPNTLELEKSFEGLIEARKRFDCGSCNERCSGPDWRGKSS
jgi:hypothetical protein